VWKRICLGRISQVMRPNKIDCDVFRAVLRVFERFILDA
jgi:hypothetical protein